MRRNRPKGGSFFAILDSKPLLEGFFFLDRPCYGQIKAACDQNLLSHFCKFVQRNGIYNRDNGLDGVKRAGS